MEIESFTETDEEKKAAFGKLFERSNAYTNKYPNEATKKQIVFENILNILDVIGCNLNDKSFSLKLNGDIVSLKNVYCEKSINTEGDDVICFFNETLKLLIENTKELNDTKRILGMNKEEHQEHKRELNQQEWKTPFQWFDKGRIVKNNANAKIENDTLYYNLKDTRPFKDDDEKQNEYVRLLELGGITGDDGE